MNEPKAGQRDTVIAVPLSLTDITKAFRELIALIKDASGLVSDGRKIYDDRRAREAGRNLDTLAFGPQGSRRHIEKIASGAWTLEDINAVGDSMAQTAGDVEEAIGELAQFRDALREKYGMGTAALLDELLYGPSGKQAIRHTLLDMVHAERRPGARPEDIQASAHQALGLIQALNTQLVSLHDQILKLSRERA